MSIQEENELRELIYNEALLRGLSESCRYNYFLSCRKMWNELDKHPREINNDELQNYLIEYLKGGPAKSSVQAKKAALNFLYHKVLNEERSVIKKIKGGKSTRLPQVMSMEEVQIILTGIEAYHYKVMVCLAYNCGLRVSEVINVRVTDINKFKMTLFIKNGKGRKDRYVPIPADAYWMLREYWAIRRPLKPYMFVNPRTQKPYCRESAEKVFRKSRDNAGLNGEYVFHTLRHSYATGLVEEGIDIRMLQLYLGHSSLKTTLKYIHMGIKSSERAQKVLNQCFEHFQYPGHA